MDADFSPRSRAVDPEFIALIADGADVVIGSRYVRGGGTTDWPVHRQLLSKWGNAYTRTLLRRRRPRLHVRLPGLPGDVAGRDRARLDRRPRATPSSPSSCGGSPATARRIVETPIVFRDRTRGKSKMSGRIIVESMLLVTAWGLLDRWRRLSGRFRR